MAAAAPPSAASRSSAGRCRHRPHARPLRRSTARGRCGRRAADAGVRRDLRLAAAARRRRLSRLARRFGVAAARRAGSGWRSAPPGSAPAPGGCSSACTATAACRPGSRCWRSRCCARCCRSTSRSAMAAFARWRCGRPLARRAAASRALWLLAELARGVFFTGFPWLASGYAHVDAPLGGAGAVDRRLRHRRVGAGAGGAGVVLPRRGGFGGPAAAGRWSRVGVLLLAHGAAEPRSRGPAGTAQRHAAAGQRAAGREVLARPRAGGAGLGTQPSCWRRAATWWSRPRPSIPLLPAQLDPRLLGRAARSISSTATQAALIGMPLGDEAAGYTNSVVGSRPRPSRCPAASTATTSTTWCRSASSSRPASSWFTQMMNIPLGDFNRGPLVRAVVRRRAASASRRTSATRTCSARSWRARFVDAASAPTMFANLSNIGWFGNTIAVDAAPADLAHAHARVPAPDAARHQHRRDRGHRPPRRASPRALPPFTQRRARRRRPGPQRHSRRSPGGPRAPGCGRCALLALGVPLAARCGGGRAQRRAGAPRKIAGFCADAGAPTHPTHADLPANHPAPAGLLGRAGLRAAAALRHGGRRRHQPHRDLPARARPRAVEGRLRAAEPPARRTAATARTRTGCSTTTSTRWC